MEGVAGFELGGKVRGGGVDRGGAGGSGVG